MTSPPTNVVSPAAPWLSQGDVFRAVPVVRAGISNGQATTDLQNAPAMLISHGCAIDKKTRSGRSALDYLSFLPLHNVVGLEPGHAAQLRDAYQQAKPYKVMYLGNVPNVGDSYVDLTEPYTLPAVLLRTELKHFSAEETGEGEDDRIVATMHQTRVATLTPAALRLFHRKWSVQWTRWDPFPEETGSG